VAHVLAVISACCLHAVCEIVLGNVDLDWCFWRLDYGLDVVLAIAALSV